MVEADCELTCKLKMLCLVFADRNVSGVVKENVGGLEDRI
jgi:hypothetical protein